MVVCVVPARVYFPSPVRDPLQLRAVNPILVVASRPSHRLLAGMGFLRYSRSLHGSLLGCLLVSVVVSALPAVDVTSPPDGQERDLPSSTSTTSSFTCACESDAGVCPAGRTAKSSRCPPCGLVCAKQTGETCSLDQPCAKDFGLTCDPVSGTCRGELSKKWKSGETI